MPRDPKATTNDVRKAIEYFQRNPARLRKAVEAARKRRTPQEIHPAIPELLRAIRTGTINDFLHALLPCTATDNAK